MWQLVSADLIRHALNAQLWVVYCVCVRIYIHTHSLKIIVVFICQFSF